MYDICVGENTAFKLPWLDYRGTPTGIDIRKRRRDGRARRSSTPASAVRDGGQIGAGVVRAPMECFDAGRRALDAA